MNITHVKNKTENMFTFRCGIRYGRSSNDYSVATSYATDLGASPTHLTRRHFLRSCSVASSPLVGFFRIVLPAVMCFACLLFSAVGYMIIPLFDCFLALVCSRILWVVFKRTVSKSLDIRHITI